MYELPDNLDLTFLIGQEVNLISVGPYDAGIAMGDVVIQAFHKLEGEVAGVRKLWFDGQWITTDDIIAIPKQEVVAVTKESDLILKLGLSNGDALFFHTEVSSYESITINNRKDGRVEVI